MKYIFSIVVTLFFGTSLFSQDNKAYPKSLVGTYLPSEDIIQVFCTLTLNSDGTATQECKLEDANDVIISKGKWTVKNKTLTVQYEGKDKLYVKYIIGKNCLLNPDGKKCSLQKK